MTQDTTRRWRRRSIETAVAVVIAVGLAGCGDAQREQQCLELTDWYNEMSLVSFRAEASEAELRTAAAAAHAIVARGIPSRPPFDEPRVHADAEAMLAALGREEAALLEGAAARAAGDDLGVGNADSHFGEAATALTAAYSPSHQHCLDR
jgi:hypothetical protein